MSSFSSKLARITHMGPAPKSAEPKVHADVSEARTLDDLRDRIAQILAKSPAPRSNAADPTGGDLPFVREETALGPLYVRTKKLSAAHRVGHASLCNARDASSSMLGLLALDPALSVLDPARALYVDTETTGLAGGAGTVPFLIGLAWFDGTRSTLVLEQLLLRQLGEEAPMLERLAVRVREASMLVSYNGKSFDVPLLRTRFVLNRVAPMEERPHLDLVHLARRVHRPRLQQFTLATIERRVLGFERTADISSGEVVARFAHFLRTGDDGALEQVIDHNEWDIVAMAALVGLYGEPLRALAPADLVGVARTLKRAGALELADSVVARAVDGGAGADGIRARGEIAKARGDKARALLDFASLVDEIDDPALRLELAKLYEHHAKEPLAALAIAVRGTGETEQASERRVQRLLKKGKRRRV
jgi:uncharacterized protein